MSVNMFMDFGPGGIKGESEDEDHVDWVEVTSFSHSFEQPTNPARSQSGGTIEKCTHNPFEVSRKMDVASVPMMKACWAGKIWPTVTFQAFRAGEPNGKITKYLDVAMQYCIIASYSISGGEGDLPEESLTFNYGVVTYTYLPSKKDTLEPDSSKSKVHKHNLITNKIE